jgi:hypothetical protein
MARIVQGPDDCAYYPRDDHDDVDVDSDSKDVFGVENTHIKCSLHEDYYVPVVTAEIVEPHIGMILEVSNRPDAIENDYDDDDGGSGGDTKEKDSTTTKINNKIRYQLTQPMDLDLGATVKHAADYAYIPVLSARVEPIVVVTPQKQNEPQQKHEQLEELAGNDGEEDDDEEQESDKGKKRNRNTSSRRSGSRRGTKTTDKTLVGAKDSRTPNEWWQWWIPWSTWRQQRKDDESGGHHHQQHHQERYRMKENKAFAGGSHGQVWRGTRRCDDRDDDDEKKRSQTNGRRAAVDSAHQYQLSLDDPPRQEQEQDEAAAVDDDDWCNESLVFKKLKVEQSYRILEAGLREVYFGHLLLSKEKQEQQKHENDETEKKTTTKAGSLRPSQGGQMFTRYVDHFFLERSNNSSAPQLELWIVYRYAGPSLRSFLYTGSLVGDYMIFQNSRLWTQLRKSMSASSSRHQKHQHKKQHVQTEKDVNRSSCEDCDVSVILRHPTSHLPRQDAQEETENVELGVDDERQDEKKRHQTIDSHPELPPSFARDLMRSVLKQILESAAFLHENGIVQ